MRLRLVSILACLLVLLAGCDGGGGNRVQTGGSTATSTITALTVSPAATSANVGATVSYRAVASYSDGSTADLTGVVGWTSSQPSVASISNASGTQGIATARQPGQTAIQAGIDGVSASATLTVAALAPVSLAVSPATLSVGVGATRQLQAFAVLGDGTQVDVTDQVGWSSSTASATVSNAAGTQGRVRGVSAGAAVVTATGFGFSASSNVTVTPLTVVSVDVTPPDLTLALGTGDPLEATAIYSDGSKADVTASATWTSGDPAVATVSPSGRVQSVGQGRTTVTATFSGASGTCAVTVTGAALTDIVVEPDDASLPLGRSVQYHAVGIYTDGTQEDLTDDATWGSAPATVATVDPSGRLTTVGVGGATVTATLGAISGTTPVTVTAAVLTSLAVTPANQAIPVGLHQQYRATGTFSDGTTADVTDQVTWAAAPHDVLTIAVDGLAQAVGQGSATVTATLGAISGSTGATGTPPVVTAVAVTPPNVTLTVGMRQQYTATATLSDGTTFDATRDAAWSSNDRQVIRVSSGRHAGRATAESVGSATLTATVEGVAGQTGVKVATAPALAIEVTPNPATVGAGRYVQFRAVAIVLGVFRVDVTDLCLWTSSDRSIARVSTLFDPGLAHGRAPGTVTITATFAVLFQGTATLTVQ